MTPQPPLTFRVSPNANLIADGLQVNGQLQPLRHQQDFLSLVEACGPAIMTVLEVLFPEPTAVPLENGEVEANSEEAWSHFNQHLMSLKLSTPGTPEFISHGRVLLQWCIAASVAVEIQPADIQNTSEFMPVNYLAEKGSKALACSCDQWAAHLEWLTYSQSPQGFRDRVDGDARPDPKPGALFIPVPWPAALGARFDESTDIDATIFAHYPDIFVDEGGCFMKFRAGRVNVKMKAPLQQTFEELAQGRTGDELQLRMRMPVGDKDYSIRAQRSRFASGKVLYCFRVLSCDARSVEAPVLTGADA